ncbi:unnamed protein product [Mucor fragilis]
MLTKDLTPNPKAVNIIRPFNHHPHPHHHQQQQQQQQQQHLFSNQFSPSQIIQRQPNFSSSTNSSSCTFSTASTTTTSNTVYNTQPTHHNTTTTTPMIRQPSSETSPGLSFFCQSSTNTLTKASVSQYPFENMHQKQSQQQPPLVISRINLSNFNRRPTIQTDLENGITTLDNADDENDDDENNHAEIGDDDDDDDLDDIDMVIDDIDNHTQMDTVSRATEEETHQKTHRMPSSFTPGFGIMSGGLGSFLLRGTMAAQPKPQPVEDARVHRKIEDLEIEKKSLLTLNQTLETVVKEQSNTISDLQDRLAAIERPLTPGLDTSSSKNGIMVLFLYILNKRPYDLFILLNFSAFTNLILSSPLPIYSSQLIWSDTCKTKMPPLNGSGPCYWSLLNRLNLLLRKPRRFQVVSLLTLMANTGT